MNLVLSIDAIQPPLAGIGRYAWELATRLPKHGEIESIRFTADGFWRKLPRLQSEAQSNERYSESPRKKIEIQQSLKARLRQSFGRIPLLAMAHAKFMPLATSIQLNSLSRGVFHGPNYFVPKTRLTNVVTMHDLSIYRFPHWHPRTRIERMRQLMPVSAQRAQLVLTDSEATRREVIKEFDLHPDKVRSVLLGVDQNYFPRKESELTEVLAQFGLCSGRYSLFVSTIEPRKNIANLIAAYRNLPLVTRLQWPLVLVGGKGWQSEEIHAAIDAAKAEGWLKYLGFVNQRCLPFLYAGCRLFTYPSWYEGFGLPIAEAMASGVPVLTSNCSSMPEVAAGAAILVEPEDIADITEKLQYALENETWRSQAIERGLLRAAQLTWDNCVAGTVAAYRFAEQQR
ncbi:MAG: glycosyltransferase family 4 protein [Burkholderiaceae bacterium]|nr:glycosyltransferase family 4 protein [Burkholderiaceae bacterium]